MTHTKGNCVPTCYQRVSLTLCSRVTLMNVMWLSVVRSLLSQGEKLGQAESNTGTLEHTSQLSMDIWPGGKTWLHDHELLSHTHAHTRQHMTYEGKEIPTCKVSWPDLTWLWRHQNLSTDRQTDRYMNTWWFHSNKCAKYQFLGQWHADRVLGLLFV